jgi:hypothetical protein
MEIDRLNGWVEAVRRVDHAYDNVKAVTGTNAREVKPKLDLESARNDGRKRADFQEVDHMHQSSVMRVRSGLNSVPRREGIFHALEARFEPGEMPQQN